VLRAAADNNDPKTLYHIVRELTGARINSNVPIKSKDGKVLLTNVDQVKRWTEHFHEVLNQPEPTMLFNFEQESNIASVDISVQDIIQEVTKDINSQKNSKSPGLDGISAELLKHGKNTLAEELTQLFNTIWHGEKVPDEWRQGIILPLPKKDALATAITGEGSLYCRFQVKYFAP